MTVLVDFELALSKVILLSISKRSSSFQRFDIRNRIRIDMVPIGRRRHIEGRIDRSREASSYDVKTNDGNGYVEREMTSDTDTKKKGSPWESRVVKGNRRRSCYTAAIAEMV
jgi:hypothetical protein